eukprot:PhF_6_TR10122/c0_g1_i1/m.15736
MLTSSLDYARPLSAVQADVNQSVYRAQTLLEQTVLQIKMTQQLLSDLQSAQHKIETVPERIRKVEEELEANVKDDEDRRIEELIRVKQQELQQLRAKTGVMNMTSTSALVSTPTNVPVSRPADSLSVWLERTHKEAGVSSPGGVLQRPIPHLIEKNSWIEPVTTMVEPEVTAAFESRKSRAQDRAMNVRRLETECSLLYVQIEIVKRQNTEGTRAQLKKTLEEVRMLVAQCPQQCPPVLQAVQAIQTAQQYV